MREIHRGPVNFPHKWPVTRKMFPFDDVIMRCGFGWTLLLLIYEFELHEINFYFETYLGTICIFAWNTYSYAQQALSHSLLHWKQGTSKYDGALQQNFDRKHDRNQWVKYFSTNILWDVIFHRFTQVTLWNRCWCWGLSSFVWMSLVTNWF